MSFHQYNTKKYFAFFLILFISIFFIAKTESVHAGVITDCDNEKIASDALGTCTRSQSATMEYPEKKTDVTCREGCTVGASSWCGQINANYCKWLPNGAVDLPVTSPRSQAVVVANGPEICDATGPTAIIICALKAILKLAGWLLAAAAALFGAVVDAEKLRDVIANDAIYTAWQAVRDFLNIAFILFLLYAAFSIIFQVGGKFGEKKIILTIVLMALLVNFSFPITRFVIDVSNSLMYTLLLQFFKENAENPGAILTGITDSAGIKTILTAPDASITQLLASIIFVFMLALTFLSMALLFLIRIIALGILIIFSPVAFVGSIIGKGGQWWDYLFKYAFFGPIMVFMLHVAVATMAATVTLTVPDKSIDGSIITAIGQLMIPLTILWIGMGVAQKMGIEGAGAVVGQAQKFAKWVPNAMAKSTGIPGGLKKAADYYGKKGAPLFLGKIPGFRGSEKTESTEAWIASKLGVRGAKEQDMKKRAEEYKKENTNTGLLKDRCSAGDAAACYRLAEDGDMESSEYDKFMQRNRDESLQKAINKKVKKNRIDILISSQAEIKKTQEDYTRNNPGQTINIDQAKDKLAEDLFGKLNNDQWNEQYWGDMLKGPEKTRVQNAAKKAYVGLHDEAKETIKKSLNGKNAAALKGIMTNSGSSETKRPAGFNRS